MQTLDSLALATVTGGSLHSAGESTGFGLGVGVTHALRLVPGWNKQLPDKPPGFQKRHLPVAGPWITGKANKLSPGPAKEFLSGMGEGATAAPQWSYDHGL